MKKLALVLSLLLAGSVFGCSNQQKSSHKHHYEYVEEEPATCEESGVEAHYICSGCDKLFILNENNDYVEVTLDDLVIVATGHDLHTETRKEATCEEPGHIEHQHCERCGKVFLYGEKVTEEQITIRPTGHLLRHINAVLPTCTADGNEEYDECTRCHKLFQNGVEITLEDTVVGALGHTLEVVPEVSPTCNADGTAAHKKCTRCNKLFKDDVEVTTSDLVLQSVPYKHKYNNDGKCTVCNHVTPYSIDEPNVRAGKEYTVPITNKVLEFSLKSLPTSCSGDSHYLAFDVPSNKVDTHIYVAGCSSAGYSFVADTIGSQTVGTTIRMRLNAINHNNTYHFHIDLQNSTSNVKFRLSLDHSAHNLGDYGQCRSEYCEYYTGNDATVGANISALTNKYIPNSGVVDVRFVPSESTAYRLQFVCETEGTTIKLNLGYLTAAGRTASDYLLDVSPVKNETTYTRDFQIAAGSKYGYIRIKNNSGKAITIANGQIVAI